MNWSTMEQDKAFVTLATDDNYAIGALVLGYSLRRVQTVHKLVVLITPDISSHVRSKLSSVFDLVQEVNIMDSKDEINLDMLTRPELGVTFTKLHCWKLTQFEKCVFLDADIVVVQNVDELLEKDELSAVPDIGWPDCFNSGVFVYKPSLETFHNLIQLAVEKGSFDGGDQGLLNTFFADWATKDIAYHLSFIYNMNTSTSYTYSPAYKQFGKNVKIVHFLGAVKPWMHTYDEKLQAVRPCENCSHSPEHLLLWWNIYLTCVKSTADEIEDIVSEAISELAVTSPEDTHPSETLHSVLESLPDGTSRQLAWEQGQIDYLGRDSFENIQRKLDDVINGNKK